jgi:NAD-dependent DNA ligase
MGIASFALRMAMHPKAAQEFSLSLQAIQLVMTDPKASRDDKRKTLSGMVNQLSENTFKLKPIAEQIMTIINMKEEVCREYPDSESQTDGILVWLPRFKEHREMLLGEVKRNRKQFGLVI